MAKLPRRRLHVSHLLDSTLRLIEYLPSPLREAAHWWLFSTPFLHRRSPEQLEILTTARPFLVPSGPYLLKGYRYPGKGPTVVLTHGWQGSAASWFRLIPMLVEAGFSVVTFDAPGHSGRPRVATLPVYAQGLTDVVELFAPVHALVGHSFGGMASARVAQSLPDLGALAIIGTPDKTRTLVDSFARRMAMRGQSLAAFERRLQAVCAAPIEEEATSVYVSKVGCPLLVLHDRDDDVIRLEDAEAIARAGRTTLEVSTGLGHRAIIRDAVTLQRVVDFILSTVPKPETR
jgi:pimeloyl-ACP methyl ester carboxylesterase